MMRKECGYLQMHGMFYLGNVNWPHVCCMQDAGEGFQVRSHAITLEI